MSEDTVTEKHDAGADAGLADPGRPDAPPPAPPAGWDPYSPPPAPAGWDPYSPPPAPAGWDPYSPPPGPAGWDPYTPPNGDRPHPGPGRGPGTGWARGLVTHLWSYNTSPGVWVGIHGAGWRRLSPASASGHSNLTMLALLAKNHRLPVTYHEDGHGHIDQLVV